MARLAEVAVIFGLVILGVKYLYDRIEWTGGNSKQKKEDKE